MWREQRVEPVGVAGAGLAPDAGWAGGAAAASRQAAPDDAVALVRAGLATVAGGGLLAAGVVLTLRLLSATWEPPAPVVVLVTGLAAIALVKVADRAGDVDGLRLVPLLARAGLVAIVAAMSLAPRTGAAGDWVARGVILASAATILRVPRARTGERRRRGATARPRSARRRGVGRRLPHGSLRQRFVRFEQPDGSDAVTGTVVVAIPAGARTGSGHVGFCPSFAALPAVEVTTRYDGVEATVGAAEILPWGLRVECRLADPADEPLEIPVTVVARVPPPDAPLP